MNLEAPPFTAKQWDWACCGWAGAGCWAGAEQPPLLQVLESITSLGWGKQEHGKSRAR